VALARSANLMDEYEDFVDDVFDEGDVEEVATVVESDRPLKRSRSTGGDGEVADDGADASQGDNVEVWQRPAVPEWDAVTRPLHFQWLSIDICAGEPLKKNPAPGRGVAGSKNAPVPVLLLYGVNDEGHSVLCRVHGFTPYFYFSAPSTMTRAHLPAVRAALENAVSGLVCCVKSDTAPVQVCV
jgi:DNA polymerase delta subunit 1